MKKEQFDVTGMSCAACSSRVDKCVRSLDGVSDVSVNLLKNTMSVEFDENAVDDSTIISAVEKAGYGASLKDSRSGKKAGTEEKDTAKEEYIRMKRRLISSIVFAVPLFYISMGHMMGWPLPRFLLGTENSMVFALTLFIITIPLLFINRKFFVNGFRALWQRSPNMDSLIALGSGAAVVYGIYALYKIASALGHGDMSTAHMFSMDLYFESAGMILTLITLGKFFEARAKGRTSDAIRKLMDLAPKRAVVIRDGKEIEIDAADILRGDIAVIRAGDSIPADGVVKDGSGAVDEAAITGESIPVEKESGDKLIGGTVLESGYIRMEVQKTGDETTLSGILVIGEHEYRIEGKREVVGNEMELEFIAFLDENDRVVFEQETETGESEYEYSIYSGGKLIDSFSLEVETGGNEVSVEIQTEDSNGNVMSYELSKKQYKNKNRIRVEFREGNIEREFDVEILKNSAGERICKYYLTDTEIEIDD